MKTRTRWGSVSDSAAGTKATLKLKKRLQTLVSISVVDERTNLLNKETRVCLERADGPLLEAGNPCQGPTRNSRVKHKFAFLPLRRYEAYEN